MPNARTATEVSTSVAVPPVALEAEPKLCRDAPVSGTTAATEAATARPSKATEAAAQRQALPN